MKNPTKILALITAATLLFTNGLEAKELDFIVENKTFAKNLETVGPLATEIAKGKTFIGDLNKPYFSYKIDDKTTAEAGAFLSLPFGEDKRVDTVDPVLSLKYSIRPGWKIVAGTIYQDHPLLDAIFNDDREFSDPNERGFQLRGNTKNVKQDLWLNWEQREKPDRNEKFSIGDYTQFKYAGFMVDAQVYWVHFGGQLNTGGGTKNNLSHAIGTGYSFSPKKLSKKLWFFDELGVTTHYAQNEISFHDKPRVQRNGDATRAFARIWDTEFYVLAWNALGPNGFEAIKGDPFYKAKHYQETGFIKDFWLADGVSLSTGFKAQFVRGLFVHEDLISLKWQGDFALFPDHFKKLSEESSAAGSSFTKRIAKKNYSQ